MNTGFPAVSSEGAAGALTNLQLKDLQMTQDYYGTKRITAWEETKDGVEGYGVKYADGYVSWSPKETFEAAYQPITAMSFGHALTALCSIEGVRVARAGWNGKGMWLAAVANWDWGVSKDHAAWKLGVLPWIGLRTAEQAFVPWVCSQTDMLANDWTIVE